MTAAMLNPKDNSMPSVLVMMATYNGERYVREQIESILSQEGVRVSIVIRDDCSTDSTAAVCSRIAAEHDNIDFKVNDRNKRVAKNFMDMVYEADASSYDYYAFSDQDDYWLPEKLIRAIQLIEKQPEGPWLYYSDVCNTDADLRGGKREYAPFESVQYSLPALLLVNWASGCTMVFNKELCVKLQEYEPRNWARIHDAWVHLVALSCGWTVPDLGNSYIKRRITGENSVGERNLGKLSLSRIAAMFGYLVAKPEHFSTLSAEDALAGYEAYMPQGNRDLLARFAAGRKSLPMRIRLAKSSVFILPYRKETVLAKGKLILNKY